MKSIFKFLRNFLLGFLLTWYAMDLWTLCKGDLRPLWRKGIMSNGLSIPNKEI